MATTASSADVRRPNAAWVVPLCVAIALLDGFDTQVIGPAAPAIARRLALAPQSLGPIFSASQLGFLIGAILFGTLGDRFGRKRVLIGATGLFAAATLATAFSGSLPTLLACRILAGLGLGGASPNFVSLVSEFTAPQHRARTVTMLWAAVPLGGMLGSFASAWLLPTVGWQAIFALGAALPIPVLLAMLLAMPESVEAAEANGVPVGELFRGDRGPVTAWLWLASFMTWTTLVVTAFWMPSLLQRAGWTSSGAATMLASNNAGGVVGTLLIGAAVGRVTAGRALQYALLGAAVLTVVMGLAVAHGPAFAVAAFATGFFTSAAGGAVLAVSAALYVPELRASAVGWALGVGRTGTILGPIVVGLLVSRGYGALPVFTTIAMLALVGAGAARMLRRRAALN